MAVSSDTSAHSAPASPPDPVEVTLERRDFSYYNWTLALERPILPFFLYGFFFLVLLSLLGVWPAGRVYALAVLVPMLGYMVWLQITSWKIWRGYPQLREPREYVFKDQSYLVKTAKNNVPVSYDKLGEVIESRRAFYLMRDDGSADILPKRKVNSEKEMRAFLTEKVGEVRGSSFL
ncbi:MAG: YcxB family protein [Trueperaceae bacterium]|nr:YcxB family protein [Trueperaceae bacterium]